MPDIQITGDTYTVVVQAPDVLPGPPRPWLVRAFRAGEREPLATSDHFDVEHACAAFSPATCPLCKQQAELEVQAHAEIVAEPAGAAT